MKIKIVGKAVAFATCSAFLFILSVSGCTNSTGGTTTPATVDSNVVNGIYKYSSSPFGKTYAEWSVAWWQWAYNMPATTSAGLIYHPLLDTAGTFSADGQTGSVFFIGGKITNSRVAAVTRAATIPHSLAIIFPVIAMMKDQYSVLVSAPADTLLRFIGNVGARAVSLDGIAIYPTATANSHLPSAQFTYSLPANSIYAYLGISCSPGTVSASADGFYVMLGALTIGSHKLVITNSTSDGRSQVITYNITSN